MVKLIFAGVLALTAAACGKALPAPLPYRPAQQPMIKTMGNLSGVYLSIDVRPNEDLANLAFRLRTQLRFLDMRHAIPPRKMDAHHVTVAYFRALSPNSQAQLAKAFQRKSLDFKVIGWGVAQKQAAYFAVSGIEPWREQVKAATGEPFTADDAHITFGVSEGVRKDVHGVPKPAQTQLDPIYLTGDAHLKQGDHVIW